MGITFPSGMMNNAIWGVWSLCLAIAIYVISRKFGLLKTTLLSWWVGFVLMWLAVGNMGVLPLKILYFAIPWSLLEALVAAWIIIAASGERNGAA